MSPPALPATLSLDAAAAETWDAVVVGAGPAGCAAALQLARAGARTLLVEKTQFPRWKVCGACVNGRALATLAELGLGGVSAGCGALPLAAVRVGAWGRTADLPLPAGVAWSRRSFDTALASAAIGAGAEFLPGTKAALHADPGRGWHAELVQGPNRVTTKARVAVATDGLGSPLAAKGAGISAPPRPGARIGAGAVLPPGTPEYPAGHIHMAVARGGYVGLVRVEDGSLNLAAAIDADALRRAGGPGLAAAAVLAEAGFPPLPGVEDADWRGTPPLTRSAGRVWAERLFVVDDAAGYVEPFTGEGMAWALAGGAAAAPLAVAAVRGWNDRLGQKWAAAHRRLIRQRQGTCRAMAWLLRQPTLAGLALKAVSAWPGLAAPFVRGLNRPSRQT